MVGLGLMIGAAEFAQIGKELFKSDDQKKDNFKFAWSCLIPHPSFEKYMSYSRFKDFRCFLPEIWFDLELKEKNDPWWKFAGGIAELKKLRKERVCSSSWKVVNESMSAWRP